MPIERASFSSAAGSLDIDRRLQSCRPTGAPTAPIVRVLAEEVVGAADAVVVDVEVVAGEPTETERGAQAAAGRSAAANTAREREGNRVIVTPNAEVVSVRAARVARVG